MVIISRFPQHYTLVNDKQATYVFLYYPKISMHAQHTTIDKHFKPEILKKISAGIMTKKLAQTIASNQFDVDKVYVERAWKFLS